MKEFFKVILSATMIAINSNNMIVIAGNQNLIKNLN